MRRPLPLPRFAVGSRPFTPLLAGVFAFAATLWVAVRLSAERRAGPSVAAAQKPNRRPLILHRLRAAPQSSAARPQRVQDAARLSRAQRRTARTLLGAALVMHALLIWINTSAFAVAFGTVSPRVQFVLLVAAIWLSAYATPRAFGLVGAPAVRGLSLHIVFQPLFWLVVFAFCVRLYALDTSIRLLIDEMHFIEDVLDFQHQDIPANTRLVRAIQPFYMPNPRLVTYWTWEATSVFGGSFFALRFASAVAGALTVAALYPLAAALFSRRVALAAALILATFPPHVHFSRLALINSFDPLFGTAAIALLVAAFRAHLDDPAAPRWGWYAWGGAFLGMTQYFYEAGKLFYPLFLALWVGYLCLTRAAFVWRGGVRLMLPFSVRGLALALGVALLVALPQIVTFRLNEDHIISRFESSGLNSEYWHDVLYGGELASHLRRVLETFTVYTARSDESLFYGAHTPLVLPALAPLLALGVAAIVVRRRPLASVVLWALAATSVANSFIVFHLTSARYIIAMPFLALLLALGVVESVPLVRDLLVRLSRATPLAAWLDRLLPSLRRAAPFATSFAAWLAALRLPRLPWRRLSLVVLSLALVWVAAYQTHYYFSTHLVQLNDQLRLGAGPDAFDAVLRSRSLPAGTHVHLVSRHPAFPDKYGEQVYAYLVAADLIIHVVPEEDFTTAYVRRLDPTLNHAFFIEPRSAELVILIRRYLPQLSQPQFTPFPDVPAARSLVLYTYRAPR